ncbi:hypothetical protein AAVH_43363, partial [Aphelenchoides avenae]
TGALIVGIVTLLFSALSLAIVQFRYGFPATIGLVTGSLVIYAYYRHAKWAYIPLTVQYGTCVFLCATAFVLLLVAFITSFAGRFDRYVKEYG